AEQTCLLPEKGVLYSGLEDESDESLKLAASAAVKALSGKKIETIKITLEKKAYTNAVVQGLILGGYVFDKYKSKPATGVKTAVIEGGDSEAASQAMAVAEAINYTRDIINTTPDDATPEVMASLSTELAKNNDLGCVILDEEQMKQQNMNALLAVSRASVNEARLCHLSYTPKNAKAKVVIVGKGLTYDSGGLSLKPSDFMATMKSDKSGGCAAMGIINAVSMLGLDVEVHAVIGAVENMIGGDAYKPDDVLIAKNGKSIEVKNTDAEGRLVLADCLGYAQENIGECDALLDIATLTGACAVGLGEYTSGIMTHNTDMVCSMQKAAGQSGENIAYLPFNRYLPKLLKSEVADVCHIASSRYGGAITAACFLDEFIDEGNKDKWVHIDIAGPAYVEKPWGYNPHGASGAGVALGVEFIKNMTQKDSK
ncbi:MAG: leucyl aminopeptidase, partial [Campylobacterota bacterium]